MRSRLLHSVIMALCLSLLAGLSWAGEMIKISAQQPITGRFAFAGVHINQGLADSLAYANEQGGVDGQMIEYLYEDTGYDLKRAVASFKKGCGSYQTRQNNCKQSVLSILSSVLSQYNAR